MLFFKIILIFPPVRLSNLGSDLLIDNIVQLDLADTKIISQDANVNSNFFLEICWKHDTSLQLLGIHDSSAFYSILLSFFVLEIFGFS